LWAILVSALGCGLIGGVFFTFSAFVMKALGGLPHNQGIAAMQSINIAVINPIFMMAFFGTAALCLLLSVTSFFRWHKPGSGYIIIGSLFYLIGTIMVTILFNVPRNNLLAAASPTSADGASLWSTYLTSWTAWNHVRTLSAVAAAAFFSIALVKTTGTQ
jgi:uncharacterized membrane protein